MNSQTGAVELAASDVGAVATNDFAAATNALAEAIAKAEPGNYAAVSNAAMTALQPAATNGLASAAALSAHASATNNPHKVTAAQLGALTAESDPVFAAWNGTTNGCFTAGGNIELRDRHDHIAFGYDIYAEDDGGGTENYYYQSVAFGKNLTLGRYEGTSGIAFGRDISATFYGVFIGRNIKVDYTSPSAIAIGYATPNAPLVANGENTFNITTPDPSHFWFNSIQGSTARTLQSYLDERAKRYSFQTPTTNEIACADGNLYSLTADTNGVSVTLPVATAYVQDFVIRLEPADTNGTFLADIAANPADATAWQYDYPLGTNDVRGVVTEATYFTFTQVTTNRWSIGCYPATKKED